MHNCCLRLLPVALTPTAFSLTGTHVTTVRHVLRLLSPFVVVRDCTMTSSPQPARTWHSHYDDPNGDLILISNESVKFRISARLLAKAWSVFFLILRSHRLTTFQVTTSVICLSTIHLPFTGQDLPYISSTRLIALKSSLISPQ